MSPAEFCRLRAKQLYEKSVAPSWVSIAASRTFKELAERDITTESIDAELRAHEGQAFGRKEVDLLGAIAAKIDVRSFMTVGKSFFEATDALSFENEVNKRILRSEKMEISKEEHAEIERKKWKDNAVTLHGAS